MYKADNKCEQVAYDCGPDRECYDIKDCNANDEPIPTGTNTYRWICPSSSDTTRCELFQIYGLNSKLVSSNGTEVNVAFKDVVPVYPTIENAKCRGLMATTNTAGLITTSNGRSAGKPRRKRKDLANFRQGARQ